MIEQWREWICDGCGHRERVDPDWGYAKVKDWVALSPVRDGRNPRHFHDLDCLEQWLIGDDDE